MKDRSRKSVNSKQYEVGGRSKSQQARCWVLDTRSRKPETGGRRSDVRCSILFVEPFRKRLSSGKPTINFGTPVIIYLTDAARNLDGQIMM